MTAGSLPVNFDELFANVCDALRREQRISYRALRRRFELSDDDLADLMDELIHAKKWAVDEDSRVLVWTGETGEGFPISITKFWGLSKSESPQVNTVSHLVSLTTT
jgi:hypothetical protein